MVFGKRIGGLCDLCIVRDFVVFGGLCLRGRFCVFFLLLFHWIFFFVVRSLSLIGATAAPIVSFLLCSKGAFISLMKVSLSLQNLFFDYLFIFVLQGMRSFSSLNCLGIEQWSLALLPSSVLHVKGCYLYDLLPEFFSQDSNFFLA